MKVKCPRCGSARLYQEVSVLGKKKINPDKNGNNKIYDIGSIEDNIFDSIYCENCDFILDGYGMNATEEEDTKLTKQLYVLYGWRKNNEM